MVFAGEQLSSVMRMLALALHQPHAERYFRAELHSGERDWAIFADRTCDARATHRTHQTQRPSHLAKSRVVYSAIAELKLRHIRYTNYKARRLTGGPCIFSSLRSTSNEALCQRFSFKSGVGH